MSDVSQFMQTWITLNGLPPGMAVLGWLSGAGLYRAGVTRAPDDVIGFG